MLWVRVMSAAVECVHCGRPIVHDEVDGWVDPLATGDDVSEWIVSVAERCGINADTGQFV